MIWFVNCRGEQSVGKPGKGRTGEREMRLTDRTAVQQARLEKAEFSQKPD